MLVNRMLQMLPLTLFELGPVTSIGNKQSIDCLFCVIMKECIPLNSYTKVISSRNKRQHQMILPLQTPHPNQKNLKTEEGTSQQLLWNISHSMLSLLLP